MGTESPPGKSRTFQRLCLRVALPLALTRRMAVSEALEQQRFRAYNRTTLLAGVAEAASASGDDVKRFWPFALRHFVTPVAGYYLCDRYVGDEVERYGLPPPVGARLELMAAAAAAVAPFASVYVQARYVEAFAASVVPTSARPSSSSRARRSCPRSRRRIGPRHCLRTGGSRSGSRRTLSTPGVPATAGSPTACARRRSSGLQRRWYARGTGPGGPVSS